MKEYNKWDISIVGEDLKKQGRHKDMLSWNHGHQKYSNIPSKSTASI